jgi:hypothetical protein
MVVETSRRNENMSVRAAFGHDWRRQLAAGLFTATTLMAVVIVSRQLGGHLERGLPPFAVCLLVALLSAVNVLAAALMKSVPAGAACPTGRFGAAQGTTLLATLVAPLALGVSLLPAGSVAGLSSLILLALCLGAGLLLSGDVLRFAPAHAGRAAAESILAPAGLSAAGRGDALVFEPLDECDEAGEEHQEDHACSQSMTRLVLPDGSETIEGTVKLAFAAGQQVGAAHLPFSPPLAGRPEVTCHLLDDRPVRLRVTAVHTFGARVEARRTGETADADEVVIGYAVTAANPHWKAA